MRVCVSDVLSVCSGLRTGNECVKQSYRSVLFVQQQVMMVHGRMQIISLATDGSVMFYVNTMIYRQYFKLSFSLSVFLLTGAGLIAI